MDIAGDSDYDNAFEGDESGVFEQMALIQHRVTELFGFEPKNQQVEAIRHLLYTIKATSFWQSIPIIGLVLIVRDE
jgi:hypothetical protein